MKKIFYIICILTIFNFVSDVKALSAPILTCNYGNSTSDNQGTLRVYLYNDTGASGSTQIVKYMARYEHKRSNGKDVNKVSNVNYDQWLSTMPGDSNIIYGNYIGDNRKCPTYFSSYVNATKNLDYDTELGYMNYDNYVLNNPGIQKIHYSMADRGKLASDIYINFNKDKADKRGNTAKIDNNTSGNNSSENKTKYCYYDINGNLLDSNSGTAFYISSNSNLEKDVTLVGMKKPFVSTDGFRPTNALLYAKDFIKDGKFTCVNKLHPKSSKVGSNLTNNIYVSSDMATADDTRENSDDFMSGSVDDEWIEGPSDLGEFEVSACEVLSKDSSLYKIMKQIIGYVQIGTIFIVILLSGLDFVGAISSGNDDAFKKSVGKTKNRIIALVLVFLVPAIVNILLTIVNVGACGSNTDFMAELFK